MNEIATSSVKALSRREIGKGDCVMFDIDDTLWRPRDNTLIQEMLDLLYTARMLGYYIVIITARPSTHDNQRWTVSQLHQMGIVPDHLAFCPPEVKDDAKDAFSSAKKLRFILSVGDQWTDLGRSQWWLKLPDHTDSKIYTNIPRSN